MLGVGADCAELERCAEVFGELWVYLFNLEQGVPHSGADSLRATAQAPRTQRQTFVPARGSGITVDD